MLSTEPKVSIICIAYDHELYIRDAIDSFLMQITDFPFEVILHDDASTDGTADIIREYQKQYPDTIKAILQQDNQHSKGISILNTFVYPEVKGKYIAVCEGDDYWTEPYKLQRQYDYMESHPDCSMCVHNSIRKDEKGITQDRLTNLNKSDRDYSTNEIIAAGGGELFHTSSFFARIKDYMMYPEAFIIPGIGDYPKSIWMSLCGSVHYFGQPMSVYRVNVKGSWSERSRGEQLIKSRDNLINGLRRIDAFTGHQYHKEIEKRITIYEYQKIIASREKRKILLKPRMWKLYTKDTIRRIRRIKRRLRNS